MREVTVAAAVAGVVWWWQRMCLGMHGCAHVCVCMFFCVRVCTVVCARVIRCCGALPNVLRVVLFMRVLNNRVTRKRRARSLLLHRLRHARDHGYRQDFFVNATRSGFLLDEERPHDEVLRPGL